jgi:thiamine pyrophosphate-dependent acetolactate synthase large subunit-like protein
MVAAMGGYGEVVENPDDITPALKRSFDAKVPALIEAVSANIISPITSTFLGPSIFARFLT